MSNSGKFDDLTKQLITHLLGFKEDEENFIRSEQFVLSNLLYHHCLAVNSHAVRRSIDGLALKFTIHGQHQRASRLKDLTQKFVASPIFKDHHEA
ncbi:Gamma-tubulin complex component 5 [Portunus trituberculatus]|uniref:Gamma-tubulin complex component 5 n=1 Tax=Portunus trituberculatus TaxID=210409 RepID=A0A5B7E3L7_PORTR|nr:Gamma-tubulin complex component 5 [Portunus trituberculatus]